MTLPLLILRPLDGALQTERRSKDLGLSAVVDPLFTVEPVTWSAPEAKDFDALLLTSCNAIKHGGAQLQAYRSLPVLAVGKKTAQAAEDIGFDVDKTGEAGVQQTLSQLADNQYPNLLWLAGEQHTTICSGKRQVHIAAVYRSKEIALGDRARACLSVETVILLHSARAAKHFVAELDRLGLLKSPHHVLAFSAKVAEAAGQGWKSIQTTDRPDDDALLSLASALCR